MSDKQIKELMIALYCNYIIQDYFDCFWLAQAERYGKTVISNNQTE